MKDSPWRCIIFSPCPSPHLPTYPLCFPSFGQNNLVDQQLPEHTVPFPVSCLCTCEPHSHCQLPPARPSVPNPPEGLSLSGNTPGLYSNPSGHSFHKVQLGSTAEKTGDDVSMGQRERSGWGGTVRGVLDPQRQRIPGKERKGLQPRSKEGPRDNPATIPGLWC